MVLKIILVVNFHHFIATCSLFEDNSTDNDPNLLELKVKETMKRKMSSNKIEKLQMDLYYDFLKTFCFYLQDKTIVGHVIQFI